jgi:hypothetical protein
VMGVRRADGEDDTERLALFYWLVTKSKLRDRRQNAARAKAKRERREQ